MPGMYCATNDPAVIETGLENVKTVLAENYVRPDEAEKVKSLVRERHLQGHRLRDG